MSPDSAPLRVSVVIPSFESHATARATLESLRQQTFRDFETILIDSSESDAIAQIARDFPEVRFHRAKQRLLPHEARNVGVKLARYDLLLFTDPDIVAKSDWIERLLAAHGATTGAIAGAVASLQKTWLLSRDSSRQIRSLASRRSAAHRAHRRVGKFSLFARDAGGGRRIRWPRNDRRHIAQLGTGAAWKRAPFRFRCHR